MKKKHLWSAYVNIGAGLHHEKPVKLVWNKDTHLYLSDMDKDGDYDAKEPGVARGDRWYQFSSFNKKEVELFISGAQAFRDSCLAPLVKES